MVDWNDLDYATELTEPASSPTYQRIVAWIRRLIGNGQLRTGDPLPTEREFARLAGLSRGTVSLAYAELKREGILAAVPGRGSRVASDQYVSTESRKEQAIRVLSNALERLESLGFTHRDVDAFLHLVQLGREGRQVRVRAALVDCNPEALGMLSRQLSTVSNLALTPRLLEDFQRLGPEELLGFDLVLTTERHTPQVMGQLARKGFPLDRLISVAVSPSRGTLIALARLPEGSRLQIQTDSARFAEIIHQHLANLGHAAVASDDLESAPDRVIVPADGHPAEDAIPFDYQVDRGSVLRVEETVTALLLQKGTGLMGER